MGDPAAAAPAPLSAPDARRIECWFYIGVALMMLVLNAVAFAPSLVDSSGRRVPLPLTPLVTAHAAVSVAWLLLFLLQASLVATGRTQVHRRTGVFGAVLAVAFVTLGSLTVIAEARRGFDLSGDIARLPLPPGGVDLRATQVALLFFFLQFAVLVGAALWYRTRPAVHKRLMLIALLGALTPTPVAHLIGHWLGPQQWAGLLFPVSLAFFLSFVLLHDRVTEGRVHPVSLWGSLALFGSNLLFNIAVLRSDAWRQFSLWLIEG
jgi:hypothetical protein